jgi:hypothetical protein
LFVASKHSALLRDLNAECPVESICQMRNKPMQCFAGRIDIPSAGQVGAAKASKVAFSMAGVSA